MDYKTLITRALRIEGIPEADNASSVLLVNPHSYNEEMLWINHIKNKVKFIIGQVLSFINEHIRKVLDT